MLIYADSSALAKLILIEAGTGEMRASVAEADRLVSASVGYVELRAALAAAFRQERLPAPSRDEYVLTLSQLWDRVVEIPVDRPLIHMAGDLAEQWQLRGYDAVHLAALNHAGKPGEALFACWDDRLRRAAGQLGYQLLPQ
ncbi:MAG: type II toxin-antitoxin system VapC family toxin [Chloroflexota bacterium]|nr:type II toxin-antitoxin system VapC family toxin [Chloroflexota bacterium]